MIDTQLGQSVKCRAGNTATMKLLMEKYHANYRFASYASLFWNHMLCWRPMLPSRVIRPDLRACIAQT